MQEPTNDIELRPINPYAVGAEQRQPRERTALVESGAARETAEIQAAMTIAKRFPRDHIDATDRILQACTRPSLAEGALYSYSRGGTEITGPSIRLAEVAAQAWGNLVFGIREVEQRAGESTVEAYAWDLETNVRQSKVFQVRHMRHTRKGAYKLEDPRDIYELVANQGARRLRACILGVIPGDVIENAVRQCEETLHSHADTSPEGLKKLEAAFAEFGVVREQLEKRIQCRLEAIRPAQVVQFKKIWRSMKDGMSGPADWFEPVEAEGDGVDAEAPAPTKAQNLKEKVRAQAEGKGKRGKPEKATESPAAASEPEIAPAPAEEPDAQEDAGDGPVDPDNPFLGWDDAEGR